MLIMRFIAFFVYAADTYRDDDTFSYFADKMFSYIILYKHVSSLDVYSLIRARNNLFVI